MGFSGCLAEEMYRVCVSGDNCKKTVAIKVKGQIGDGPIAIILLGCTKFHVFITN